MLRIVSRRCVRGLAAAVGGVGGPAVPLPGIPVTSPCATSLGSSLSAVIASGRQFESFHLIRQASSEASAACPVSHPTYSDNEVAETEDILFVVDRLLGEGDAESALETLEAGLKLLTERFGPGTRGLLPIYGQLALLHYANGNYPAALEAAQRCYAAAVQRDGEGAPSTLPHAVRYGVMLLASGDPDGALPLLQHSACQLERQVQRLGAAAGALQPRQRHEIGQLQDLMSDLFESTVALAEATYYRALARIAGITRDNNASCGSGEQGGGQGLSQFHHHGGPHPGDSLHAAPLPGNGGNPGAVPSCCTGHSLAGSELPEGAGATGSQGITAAGFVSQEVSIGGASAASRGNSSSSNSSGGGGGSGSGNGSGCREVVLLAEGGLVDGLLMLRHSLEADHLIVGAALREHGRLVRRTAERGQQAAYIELALQNKRLHDTMRAALLDCFASTDDDE